MKLLFVVVAVAISAVSGQETCGCAAQPTIIQVSCDGGNQAPPPAPEPSPPAPSPTDMFKDLDPRMCEADENGYPTHPPAGGFPNGFKFEKVCYGPGPPEYDVCEPQVKFDDPSIQRPPPNWDGRFETLGFPMVPGTAQFNVIMCWPLAVPVITYR